jgi:hypothetical protein
MAGEGADVYVTNSYEDPAIIPPEIRSRYKFIETQNAPAILSAVASAEFAEFLSVLDDFTLHPNEWLQAGGNKGDLTDALDQRILSDAGRRTLADCLDRRPRHVARHQLSQPRRRGPRARALVNDTIQP